MRLIRCHVENFGKLSNLSIDFQNAAVTESGPGNGGFVIINEKNGTGKSTLAAFIKVMFFGFANEGKRNEIENERKRFCPWQGGTYGGQLTFSVGDKIYTINRTFGKKEKEDTFTLYDAQTNLESTDYTEDIGEEILQIDHDSFLRTVFISQNDCATMSTDSINAKLGNLSEATDDINNYESVYRLLSDSLNSLSPTRKTGQLFKKINEISELKDHIRKGESIDNTIRELTVKRDEQKSTRAALEKQQVDTQIKLQQMSRYKDLAAQREIYLELCNQCNVRKNILEEARKYFPGEIPDEKELDERIKEAGQLLAESHSLERQQLTPEELEESQRLDKIFVEGVPTERELDEVKNKISELADLRLLMVKEELSEEDAKRLNELEQLFHHEVPDEEMIDQKINAWNQRSEKKNLLNTKNTSVSTLRNVARKKLNDEKARNASEKTNATIFMVLGFVLMMVGLGAMVLQMAFGVVGLIIGVGFIIFGSSWRKRVTKRAKLQESSEEFQINSAEVDRLLQEIKADEDFIQETEQDCKEFFERYQLVYEEIAVLNYLNHLKNTVKEYKSLLNHKEKYESKNLEEQYKDIAEFIELFLIKYVEPEVLNEENYMETVHYLERLIQAKKAYEERNRQLQEVKASYEELLSAVKVYVEGLGMEPQENLSAQLQEMKDHCYEYKTSEREYNMALEQKNAFEMEHDMNTIQGLTVAENEESLETLNARLKMLTDQIKIAHENIAAYNKPLDKAYEDRERIAEDEVKLLQAEEEFSDLKRRYEVMEMTRKYLEKAKESFTSRYMNPVKQGFEKYYEMIAKEDASNYQIDANINLTAREHGQQRDTRLLSAGYQNLTGICMRMALLDAMFREEKPFVIFDDPFVNLDSKKVEGGLDFLEKIAHEYQVIYFTCHDSRIR